MSAVVQPNRMVPFAAWKAERSRHSGPSANVSVAERREGDEREVERLLDIPESRPSSDIEDQAQREDSKHWRPAPSRGSDAASTEARS